MQDPAVVAAKVRALPLLAPVRALAHGRARRCPRHQDRSAAPGDCPRGDRRPAGSTSGEAPDGVTFEVPAATRVSVVGIDKQLVGQVAANIRSLRKPEPYKGKGVRYAGERIIRKAGKTGK